MRLLAIAPTGFYADYGCHIRIMGQLKALQTLGYDIRLVTYPAGRDIPGLTTIRPPLPFARTMPVGSSWRKIFLDTLLGPTALLAAIRFRPHLIHAYLHEGVLIGWMMARGFGSPLTADYQGSLTTEIVDHRFLSPESRGLPALRHLEHWLDLRPDAIFPSSDQAADALAARGIPKQKIQPLPDSIDPALFQPQPRDPALLAQLGLDPARPIVVYLGLLAAYQGIDLLLHAIAISPLKSHPAQFLIMGFPHVGYYRNMAARLGIAGRVHFTGPIPYEQAPRYLALGDLAIAPKLSTTEGSGKLLPYMAMRLPVVATGTPVHRQYLGGAGILVEQQNPGAFATAIVATLSDLEGMRKRTEHLRKKVEREFTWEHTARKMSAIFRRLAGRSSESDIEIVHNDS